MLTQKVFPDVERGENERTMSPRRDLPRNLYSEHTETNTAKDFFDNENCRAIASLTTARKIHTKMCC